jgi:peptidoglycan/LPS O-acetylase OafA/YrhL
MLSGFVLMHVHGEEFQKNISIQNSKRFLLLRLARIYPLHLLALFSMLGLQLIDTGIDGLRTPFSFMTQLLLVASWGFNSSLSWNLPSWSLSSEWMGYLLFPLLAFGAGKLRQRIWQMAAIVAVFSTFYWLMFRSPYFMNYSNGLGATVRVLCGMCTGILLQQLHNTRKISQPSWTLLFWLCVPIALTTMTDISGTRLKESVWAVIMMGGLLLAASRATGWAMLPLNHKAAIYMGEISYAIYILHYPVFRLLRCIGKTQYNEIAENGTMLQVYALATLSFLTLITLSALAHEFIEKPVRQWAKQRTVQPSLLVAG